MIALSLLLSFCSLLFHHFSRPKLWLTLAISSSLMNVAFLGFVNSELFRIDFFFVTFPASDFHHIIFVCHLTLSSSSGFVVTECSSRWTQPEQTIVKLVRHRKNKISSTREGCERRRRRRECMRHNLVRLVQCYTHSLGTRAMSTIGISSELNYVSFHRCFPSLSGHGPPPQLSAYPQI